MTKTIFYSWQADRPKNVCRNFIETALEKALKEINAGLEVEDAERNEDNGQVILDRDTKNVPGTPPIVDTIFNKINAATAFVADLTFIAKRPNGEPMPNPNVLIEYGWAMRGLTHSRFVPVLNTAYGDPAKEPLPFDMRHLRHPITYHLEEGATPDERARIRDQLKKDLVEALRAILQNEPAPPPPVIKEFEPRESAETPGRFVLSTDPLGVAEEPWKLGSAYPVTLEGGPVYWLRLMPAAAPDRTWKITQLKKAALQDQPTMVTFGTLSWSSAGIGYLRREDGVGTRVMYNEDGSTICASMLFTTGEIWGLEVGMPAVSAPHNIIIADQISWTKSLDNFRTVLLRLGVSGPFRWIAGMEGTFGRKLGPERGRVLSGGHCVQHTIEAHGSLSIDEPCEKALRPFFEAISDACGVDYVDPL